MARSAFKAEADVRGSIVEIAEMLDVVAAVA